VSPPDNHGFCTLGPSVDVTRAAIQNAKFIVGKPTYICCNLTVVLFSVHICGHSICAILVVLTQLQRGFVGILCQKN